MVNSVLNRVDKFGEGVYKYSTRGFVIQNAREEKFQYNTRGFLVNKNTYPKMKKIDKFSKS